MDRGTLKYLCGATLARIAPKRAQAVREAFTLPNFDARLNKGLADRLLRYYIGEKAGRHPDGLEALHKAFWRRQGARGWHGATADRFHSQSLPLFSDLAQRCAPMIETLRIERVCELGAGDGQWLDYLASIWKGPSEMVGVDIACEQIQANRVRYPDLSFECDDLVRWIERNARPHSLYATHCGVLEYVTQTTLQGILRTIAARSPRSLVFLIEPVAEGFDLDRQRESVLQAAEMSYSHNYPLLLQEAGMSLEHREEQDFMGYRMLAVLARSS